MDKKQRYKELQDRNALLDKKLSNSISNCFIFVVIFLLLTLIGCSPLMFSEITVTARLFGLIAWGLFLITLVSYLLFERAKNRGFKDEKRELVFQIDLAVDEVDSVERRAEKILNINRYQIKQYHDFNLRQNRWIFILGLACVGAGIIVVLLTFAVVIFLAKDTNDKIIISAIGAIGSILSNFVGTIYLVMHKSAANALRDFYDKLVESHRMLVGNLVASRISVKKQREDVFAKLALEIMGKHQEEEVEPPSS